jgi:beta-glucanase (GH16 family)
VPTQVGSSQGLWPAFWLRSNETGGEIDIAEWYGSPNPNLADSYRKVDNIVHESTNGGMAKSGKSYTFPGTSVPSDGFHVYAAELLTDGIHFYVDGVQSHVVPATSTWTNPMLAGTWNIRLNFQVGKDGSWATAPTSATALPANFVVDYVRVYKR